MPSSAESAVGGLHLTAPVIFRLGHPPLLFPWHDIVAKPVKSLGISYLELRFKQEPTLPLSIRPSLAEKIREAGGKLDEES